MLSAAGFPARVSAHAADGAPGARPTATTILVKFDPEVMERQAAVEAAKRG